MDLLPADYVLGGFAVLLTVMGIFRGLSGTLAFVAALLAAIAVAFFGWRISADAIQATWMRAGAVLVATLLVFGVVRLVIRKCIHGLLAQPSDAVFGALIGGVVGVLPLFGWAMFGRYLEYSRLATFVAGLIGGAEGAPA